MKKLLILGLCLWSVVFANGQRITYEYDYDLVGNRIRCVVVRLNDRNNYENDQELTFSPFTDVLDNGVSMALFPNPTKESVRFELSGDNAIGDYVLSDITGRVVAKGRCQDTSLTLDLSNQKEGMYLLELLIEEKTLIYKIIKQ